MNDFDQYARHYRAGMKVGIGIPLPDAGVYRDWAVIRAIDEDLVSLQLSRDQLPERVSLHEGQILEVRCGTDNAAFSVRAIIVSEGSARALLLRFIGEVVSDELREFYRIDAFLPVKYFLSREQHPDVLEKQWHARRLERLEKDQYHLQKAWGGHTAGQQGELPNERQHDGSGYTGQDMVPLAANISGGGIRFLTHQGFETGEYVLLEILLPSPRRIIEAVARVAFANPVTARDAEQENYDTGLQFVFIHEHDRDAVIKYVSGVQLERIRRMRETSLAETAPAVPVPPRPDWRPVLKKAAGWLLAAGAALLLFRYLNGYMEGHPQHEIGEMFENGIKRYMEQRK